MSERTIRYEQVIGTRKHELFIWPVIQFPIVFRRKSTKADIWSTNSSLPIPQSEWDALHEVTDWCEANLPLIADRRSWAMNRSHVGVKTPEVALLFKLRWVG